MYQEQASRLNRDDWASETELASEVRAVFNDRSPLMHKAPITQIQEVATTPTQTIRVNNTGELVEILRFEDLYGNHLGGINLANGDVQVWSISQGKNNSIYPATKGIVSRWPDPNQVQADLMEVETEGTPGSSFVGVVLSGSHPTYIVALYPDGLSDPSSLFAATVTNIVTTSDIPAGTRVIVTQGGDDYYMRQLGGLTGDGSCFIGHMVSVSSGTVWNVNLYPDGTSGDAVAVTAQQLNTSWTLSAGEYWPVVLAGGFYYILNGFTLM